jgi:hypothetical protein
MGCGRPSCSRDHECQRKKLAPRTRSPGSAGQGRRHRLPQRHRESLKRVRLELGDARDARTRLQGVITPHFRAHNCLRLQGRRILRERAASRRSMT